MKKLKILLLIITLFSFIYFIFFKRQHNFISKEYSNIDLENYPKTLDSIKILRQKLQDNSIQNIGIKFTEVLTNKIFPYWYGTTWDFNGTTQKPNEGKIACGYFVTTTLMQVGLDINRVKLAQCASEEMIKKLVSKENIYRFSNQSIDEFQKSLEKIGKGIYVVGLDNHTGFVFISENGNYFIHSSGIYPFEVVKDKLSESRLIINSKYRVIGNLSSDKDLLLKWVKN
jgi:hypothetical protein